MYEETPEGPWFSRLPDWLRRLAFYVGLFVAGGLLSFGYSYAPLHQAKNWKIDHLERRLDSRIEQVDRLQQALAELRAENEGKPDSATFAQIRDELETSRRSLASLDKKLAASKRKIADLDRARASWKKRFEGAETKLAERASETPKSEGGGPGSEASATALPAAPAASSEAASEPRPEPAPGPSAIPGRSLFAPREPAG